MSSSTSANVPQGHRPRQSTARTTIVPAIPLPYIQKRKQNAGIPKQVEDEPVTPPPAVTPAVTPVSTSPPPAADITPALPTAVVSHGTPETVVGREGSDEAALFVDSPSSVKKSLSKNVVKVPELSPVDPVDSADEQANTPEASLNRQSSTESRSTYNMPPPFVPASHGQPSSSAAEPVKFPRQASLGGQHSMHQAHPSVGSLVFGGYPDSNNSSPAPPLSGGGVGQFSNQQPHEGGRAQPPPYSNGGHMHTFSNGYSPMGPPPPNYYPRHDSFVNNNNNPALESWNRRQMTGLGPPEAYSPSGTPIGVENQRFPPTFDPSTSHSFHGSQSSAADANGQQVYNQYTPVVNSNGSNGHIDETRLYHQPRPKGRTGSQPMNQGPNMSQPIMTQNMDNLDGLFGYLQSQFAEPQFADYTLELRYSDDRAPPVRIPGHNLLFARSPTLKNLMTAQARDSSSDGLTVRTLLVESDDRFLRSDGFSMAVLRLYGGPLLDPGASVSVLSPQFSSAISGTPADRFELALGYAAAGVVLQMPPVVNRGIEIASHLLSWVTLEKALDFALDGGLDAQWTTPDTSRQNSVSPSTYGPVVNMLIHTGLNFIITAFPPGFELDTSAGEPTHNRRIPLVLDNRPAAGNSRLSFIKFGDHHSEETSGSGEYNSVAAVLSRVLLNLPFHLLKNVLESSRLGNVQGWATAELRKKALRSVVEEREKRRIKVHDNRSVKNAERSANAKEWDAVGWMESLVPVQGAPDTFTLHRTWVDFVIADGSGN